MPKLPLVQAAHPYIEHPVMNKQYSGINGGCGKVIAIVILHPILIVHASISRQNRAGHE